MFHTYVVSILSQDSAQGMTYVFPAPQRAPATAFTVNFDSPSEEVSLQDAARKSAQVLLVADFFSAKYREMS